jgi:uncharacterized membrane protein YgdD (TMEM256/DUF423 family)
MNQSRALLAGSVLMAIAVALGAFGAHGLKDKLVQLDTLETFHTAVRYQAWHALGLMLLGVLTVAPERAALGRRVGWLFVIGIACFSGSLYGLALEPSMKWLGPITPLGGGLFLAGWLGMARVALALGQSGE